VDVFRFDIGHRYNKHPVPVDHSRLQSNFAAYGRILHGPDRIICRLEDNELPISGLLSITTADPMDPHNCTVLATKLSFLSVNDKYFASHLVNVVQLSHLMPLVQSLAWSIGEAENHWRHSPLNDHVCVCVMYVCMYVRMYVYGELMTWKVLRPSVELKIFLI
jgi:hypothetical protein